MSKNNYQLRVTRWDGTGLDYIDFESCEYARSVGQIGTLTLVVVPSRRLEEILVAENRIEVWRTVANSSPKLDMETAWTIRKVETVFKSGELRLQIVAYDGNYLLNRRIVAYKSGTTQASKTGKADDMMKAFVRENLSSLATDTLRRLPAEFFQVQANKSDAPVVAKAAAFRKVLATLQEIVQQSISAGTYLAFDVVYDASRRFEFRTYTGQRGLDLRRTLAPIPVIFDQEYGNLNDIDLTHDYTNEINYVYAGGTGQEEDRDIETAYDNSRINLSAFNRNEEFIDARNSNQPASVLAEAQAALRAGKPLILFNGSLSDNDVVKYGRDYNFGDLVTADFKGFAFDCRLDTIHIKVDDQGDTIEVKLNGSI